jgi:peptidyl-dipeptidase A
MNLPLKRPSQIALIVSIALGLCACNDATVTTEAADEKNRYRSRNKFC